MCLILFAVNPSPEHLLVVAANRDEQHARATQRARFWDDVPDLLAGRDLVAGGTWLGVSRNGRFAAVTNFAETPPEPIPPLTRGALTADFLNSELDGERYLEKVRHNAQEYRGFNLLLSDGNSVWYYSNRSPEIQKLESGYYGLSNQLLDCNWPKVGAGRDQLQQISQQHLTQKNHEQQSNQQDVAALNQQLFQMLADRGDGRDHSAKFIVGESYGTSVSTVVIQSSSETIFEERAFDPTGTQISRLEEKITLL